MWKKYFFLVTDDGTHTKEFVPSTTSDVRTRGKGRGRGRGDGTTKARGIGPGTAAGRGVGRGMINKPTSPIHVQTLGNYENILI